MNSKKKVFTCRKCDSKFSSVSSRRRHEKKFHRFYPQYISSRGNDLTLSSPKVDQEIKQILKCSECSCEFSTKKDIMAHLSSNHTDIELKVEKKHFKNREEFYSWKINVEKETASWFVSKRSNKNKDHTVRQYLCHRSGSFNGECDEEKRKRHLKFSGSNKSGFFCPASMTVREGAAVDVTFLSTHIGHLCEVEYLPLSLPEKNEIAGLMATGVPIPEIMDKISQIASPTTRLALTKSQDLRNIRESYGIRSNVVRCSDEVISVDSRVQEMKSQESNPILIVKLPGETELDCKNLSEGGLVLAFMNDGQEEISKLYGQDAVLIDSTRGTNKYKTGIHEVENLNIEESTELIINESSNNEASDLEKAAISNKIRKHQVSEKLKETAKAALLGFIAKLDQFTSESQYKEIIKTMSILESKCLALSTTEKILPPAVSSSAPTKNIECQRSFPLKKTEET